MWQDKSGRNLIILEKPMRKLHEQLTNYMSIGLGQPILEFSPKQQRLSIQV